MPNHLLTVGLCARDFDALNKANKDYDEIKVKASSELEAIEKAKQGARKGAMSSSFEIKKGK